MSENRFGYSDWVAPLEPDDNPAEVLASYAMSRLVARARAELGEKVSATTVAHQLYGQNVNITHNSGLRTACTRTMRGKAATLAEFLRWSQAFGVEPQEVLGTGLADASVYPPLHRQALHVPREGPPMFRSARRPQWLAVLEETLHELEDDATRVGPDFLSSAVTLRAVARALVNSGVNNAQLRMGEDDRFDILTGTPRLVEVRSACGDSDAEWVRLLAALVHSRAEVLVIVAGARAQARLDSELPGLLALTRGGTFEVPIHAHETVAQLGAGDTTAVLSDTQWIVTAAATGLFALRVLESKSAARS